MTTLSAVDKIILSSQQAPSTTTKLPFINIAKMCKTNIQWKLLSDTTLMRNIVQWSKKKMVQSPKRVPRVT